MKKAILILTFLSLSACGFEVVDTGYRGIKIRLGEVVGEPLPEGLHFYNPFTADIREYNVRQEKMELQTEIFTQDTQRVLVDFAVVYYADPKFVHNMYQEYGPESMLEEKIVKPVVLGSIKDSVGQVIADKLVSQREVVTRAALKEVQENLMARHVIVTDLQFTNLNFDDAYEKAVEEKVVAIQDAQKAKNVTVTIQEQARQTVMTAQAEAEAMKIKSQALAQNKGLVDFEAVRKWNGQLPMYMFGNSTPFINMSGLGK